MSKQTDLLNLTDVITLDGSGDVSIPTLIPEPSVAFYADGGPTQNSTVAYVVNFGTARTDTHSAGSSTRFTAPLQGQYLCSYGWMLGNSTPNRHHLRKNGVACVGTQYAGGNTYDRIAFTTVISLDVGDYLEVVNNISGGGEGHKHGSYDYFTVVKV